MLSCIYRGKPFSNKQEGYTPTEKYDLGNKQKVLLCPVCGNSVYYCDDGKRVAHFSHFKIGDCPEGKLRSYDHSNTPMHEHLTDVFINWVKSKLPGVEIIPDYLICKGLKTDIYFEYAVKKIAIEIQFKRINNLTFIERRNQYKAAGITDIWFFVEEGSFTIGSPFHKTYYHGNRRELYFYISDQQVCKAYKGYLKEKWDIVGKDTLYNAVQCVCILDEINIGQNGRLIIPQLREELSQIIAKDRESLKKQREWSKIVNAPEYQGSDNNVQYGLPPQKGLISDPLPDWLMKCRLDAREEKPITSANVKPKPDFVSEKPANFVYKEYTLETNGMKEYLNITIIYQSKEYAVKYLILKNQQTGKERFLTCIKEDDPESMRYLIYFNPFLTEMNKVQITKHKK